MKMSPEAFEYEDDITPEVVKRLQEKADVILSEDEWIIINGYGLWPPTGS